MSVLERILQTKRVEVAALRRARPLEDLAARARDQPGPFGFAAALGRADLGFRVIAEVKKASPSRGVIRDPFDPLAIAAAYERGGAAAISVLTDAPYFQGCLEHLEAIRQAVGLPLLRKDFIIDEYQVHESRASGADAILLIAAALEDAVLERLAALAAELGMDVLWEVHDTGELERLERFAPRLVGINNRNLRTFAVSLETTRELLPLVPGGALVVSESGFSTREELARMRAWGVDAFLIGESLMRAPDPGVALARLIRGAAEDGAQERERRS